MGLTWALLPLAMCLRTQLGLSFFFFGGGVISCLFLGTALKIHILYLNYFS